MNSYLYLTYNGITKIVSNTIFKTITHPNNIIHIQWFRYQIIKMCKNLEIDIHEPITGGIFNNIELAKKIIAHKNYGKFIPNKDDQVYGLKPCLEHKSVMPIPANNNQLKKDKNNVTLKKPRNIIWKCGQRLKPLL